MMLQQLVDKIDSLTDGDMLWLFYAGHGCGTPNDAGEALLVPVDYDSTGLAIPLWGWIIPELAKRNNCVFVIILDCCRYAGGVVNQVAAS